MRDIELPPYAPLLMESTRAIGYNLEAALADILDNSISANANNIEIRFNPYDEPYVAILDNGNGMGKDELINAMRYGSYDSKEKREEKDLGRFGLGLKTASLSQCRRLTVVSKQHGIITGCRWDLDYINSTGKWSLLILDDREIGELPLYYDLNKLNSGTIVIWQNIDKIVTNDKNISDIFIERMEDVRKHLSLVFHRYLQGEKGINKIKISINNNDLEPIDPFLSEKSQQLYPEEDIKIGSYKITVTPYLLPHISNMSKEEIEILGGKDGLRKNQGFYVYRNRRLLVWGDWFRLTKQDDLSKLARVKVDIPNTLDAEWTLDIKKSTATPPYVIKKNLSAITQKICESSKKTWNFRGKRETSGDIIHIWNRCVNRDGIYYEVNSEYPLIKEMLGRIDNKEEILRVFKLLGLYLPMNQIYSDLTHDQKINQIDESGEALEVKELIIKILDTISLENKNQYLDVLKNVEPFSKHKDIVDKFKD